MHGPEESMSFSTAVVSPSKRFGNSPGILTVSKDEAAFSYSSRDGISSCYILKVGDKIQMRKDPK